jgi:nitrite reductase/ring-hydroxylating ferredoxin subunit
MAMDGSQSAQDQYHDAAATADVPEGASKEIVVAGHRVLLCNLDGTFVATQATCTHYHAALDRGRIRKGWITCPWHGARFELASGKCAGNVYPALKTYPVQITGDRVLIEVTGDAPLAAAAPS